MIFWHVIINIGMVSGTLPVVGVTLPLISYGGSSILTTAAALGLVMNVSVRRFSYLSCAASAATQLAASGDSPCSGEPRLTPDGSSAAISEPACLGDGSDSARRWAAGYRLAQGSRCSDPRRRSPARAGSDRSNPRLGRSERIPCPTFVGGSH